MRVHVWNKVDADVTGVYSFLPLLWQKTDIDIDSSSSWSSQFYFIDNLWYKVDFFSELFMLNMSCVFLYREQALLTARREPVLSRERVYERIRYPNVYDCYAEAAKTPAFVGGARVSLEYFECGKAPFFQSA